MKKYKNRNFFISCLIDVLYAVLISLLTVGVISFIINIKNNLSDSIDSVNDKVENLELRLAEVENEVELLGCNLKTTVTDDGIVYIEILNLVDENGNELNLSEMNYLSSYCNQKMDEIYNTLDDCMELSELNYNYVKTLDTQDKLIYSIYDSGIIIDHVASAESADYWEFTYIEIPEVVNGMNVVGIGARAFEGTNIYSVRIPLCIKFIGASAFENCSLLENVEFYSSIVEASTEDLTIPNGCFRNCSQLLSIKLPENTKSIGSEAFSYCTKLIDIIIPDNVEFIGFRAFCCCYSFVNVVIPASVKNLSDMALSYCKNLETVTILSENCILGNELFKESNKLSELKIHSSLDLTNKEALCLPDNCLITNINN